MAADVSSLVRLMSGGRYKEGESDEGRRDLVTRDLLGGGKGKDLDLDPVAPQAWQRRLDLQHPSEVFRHWSAGGPAAGFQDLNFDPPQPPSLELKLFPVPPSPPRSLPAAEYGSVCTLDKVKSALERLKHSATPSPASSSTTTASAKRRPDDDDVESTSSAEPATAATAATAAGVMVAAGCPNCLSYVLVPGTNPRCPRCGTAVPTAAKKRRLDLNLAGGEP